MVMTNKKHTILKPQLTEQIQGLTPQSYETLQETDPMRQELLQKFENDEFIIKEINKEYSLNEMKEMFVYHPVEATDPLVFYKGRQIITYL
jgi:hypothetical protein